MYKTQIVLSVIISYERILCELNFENLNIPPINLSSYTTGDFERNFSKYFAYNTISFNTQKFIDELKNTLPESEENRRMSKCLEENRMGHCIFDDLFNMRTFKMKPEVESKFCEQLGDILQHRVDETVRVFSEKDKSEDQMKAEYEGLKNYCDKTVEEYTIRILIQYKREVIEAAAHHYDLKPKDPERLKYEDYIGKQFTKIGFEFLPIVEKYYGICSGKYYDKFKKFAACDKEDDFNRKEMENYERDLDKLRF